MAVHVDQQAVFALLDELVHRWRIKRYPFNRPDAVIPQTVLPKDLWSDQFSLACWYFYACIYMRGGIESLQAFNALIRMWRDMPSLFDPGHAAFLQATDVQPILRKYIGWDSKAASENWVFNSRWLMQAWQGNPLNLIKGVKNYDEALRRMRNKHTKRDRLAAGSDGGGFRGFQPKMVSMLLYFYDWESLQPRNKHLRWLSPRFLYPSPADFHNFRLGLATGALTVDRSIADQGWEEIYGGALVRASERLSKPWRDTVMAYLKSRKADPVEVADAIWLYSLLMCGNSPATVTKTPKPAEGLLAHANLEPEWDHAQWVLARKSLQLSQTCFVCPFVSKCEFAIPAKPYYRKGRLILRPHPVRKIKVPANLTDPKPNEVEVEPEIQEILHILPAAAE